VALFGSCGTTGFPQSACRIKGASIVRRYMDFLPIPIFLNRGAQPINRITLPWDQSALDDSGDSAKRRYFDFEPVLALAAYCEWITAKPEVTENSSSVRVGDHPPGILCKTFQLRKRRIPGNSALVTTMVW
jgi:hypothetical protein